MKCGRADRLTQAGNIDVQKGGSYVKGCLEVEIRCSLSLSLLMTSGVEGAKVLIDKPADEPVRGQQLEHRPLAPEVLEGLRATLLAEYQTMVLVEIADQDLDWAVSRATEERLRVVVREDFDRIWINGYEYPSGTPCPDLRSDQVLLSVPDGPGLWMVQMIGPPTPEWHQTLRAAGDVINVLPTNTFVIRADRADAQALLRTPGFHHVEPYQPAFKIQPRLARAPGKVRAIVQLDAGRNFEAVLTAIEAMAGRRFSREVKGLFRNLLVELTLEQISVLAQRPEVVWIEPYTRPDFSDERHAMVVAGQHDHDKPNSVQTGLRYQDWLESKGFCAPGQTSDCISYSTKVAVFDNGLDNNTCLIGTDGYDDLAGICGWDFSSGPLPRVDRHGDFGDREDRFFCLETENSFGELEKECRVDPVVGEDYFRFGNHFLPFHGTSVAGLIAGDSRPAVGGTGETDGLLYFEGTGTAPSARIVVAKIGSGANFFDVTPDTYENLMTKVTGPLVGTRFAHNSWNQYKSVLGQGVVDATEYSTLSQMMDMLVRDGSGGYDDLGHETTVVFSAGNFRTVAQNPDHLVIAPGNAKNVIAVGASDGWEVFSEGRECCNVGSPTCVEGDDISNILALSMRGTGSVIDRFKPDLVAPGSRLRTTWSRGDGSPYKPLFGCFGGTSGAAPLVTGAAILVDAWYRYPFGDNPSPAMIKAMLVAHAADLGGADESGIDRNTDQALPHSPSLAQGWGRLELDSLFSPGVSTYRVDEDHRSGGVMNPRRFRGATTTWSVNLVVDDPDRDVIIAMVFTDAPGTPSAEYPAVNDLNLVAVDGSGILSSRYYGNRFVSGGYYSRRYSPWEALLARDAVNNVEVIRFPASEVTDEDFSIEVQAWTLAGQAVPGLDGLGVPNQDFALYVVNASTAGGGVGGRP